MRTPRGIDLQAPVVDRAGRLTRPWADRIRTLEQLAYGVAVTIAATIADVPITLTKDDAGFLLTLTAFNHLLRWSGTAWTFAPGDGGNACFRDAPVPPQEAGWVPCDGAATTYLTLGALLTETAFVTPVTAGRYFRR